MRLHGLKICGITSSQSACFCVEQGVGALGAVFYPPSPRNVSAGQAAEIFRCVPETVAKVGVFVNMPVEQILQIAAETRLTTIQMHGNESNAEIQRALQAGYRVIKVLKSSGEKLLKEADNLPPQTGVMVELTFGLLPGGNGVAWEWGDASALSGKHDFALAGGLTAANLLQAAATSGANAFDLSSAMESRPGVKEHQKILELVAVANLLKCDKIFWRR
ncbi:MAG: phosphoribosylanthranilate isomerase [Kiritimatiellae bacterium]|nr:phosphoribosylanthranilate isomerase [Kiritimatiellia bacterium]